jgi:hypothetical protein
MVKLNESRTTFFVIFSFIVKINKNNCFDKAFKGFKFFERIRAKSRKKIAKKVSKKS